MEYTGAAQKLPNTMTEICYETKKLVEPFFVIQDLDWRITRNLGKRAEFEEPGPGYSLIGNNIEYARLLQRLQPLGVNVDSLPNLDFTPRGCLTKDSNAHSDEGLGAPHTFSDYAQKHGNTAGAMRHAIAAVRVQDILDFGLDC